MDVSTLPNSVRPAFPHLNFLSMGGACVAELTITAPPKTWELFPYPCTDPSHLFGNVYMHVCGAGGKAFWNELVIPGTLALFGGLCLSPEQPHLLLLH